MGWQIAIDGPAASGKSTVAKMLAEKLNFEYLDTGAMYRAVTLKALRLKINLEKEEDYSFLNNTKIDFVNQKITLDGLDVSSEIRSIEVTNNVSLVSKFKYVRDLMVECQRLLAESKNIIVDGRDIGTVVLPNADLKVFLYADVETRAKRRMLERKQSGIELSLEETVEEIKVRDYKDSHREISPLKQADDAVFVDTSEFTVKEVVDIITNLVLKRGYSMENLEQKNVNVEENKNDEQEVVDQKEANEDQVETNDQAQATEKVAEESSEETKAEGTSEEVKAEESDEKATYKEMQVVTGKVVEVQPAQEERKIGNKIIKAKEERVLIELPNGQEGFLFRKDTSDVPEDEELFDHFLEGDEVTVVVKRVFPDGGKLILSTALLEKRNKLIEFEKTVKERPIIVAKVLKLVADFGLLMKYEDFTCLLPSQLASVQKEELETLIGKEIEVVPIRIDLSRIRIIVSQIHAENKKQKAAKKEFISKVEVGQVYDGIVKNIETYGAFVELFGGVEGLLHISELDHTRVSKVEKVLNTGDTVKVQVIKVEKDHIGLSRKALLPNHWANYFADKQVGDVVTGKAIEINKAGVRIELAPEIEGFVPKSEYSYNKDMQLENVVKVGDELTGKLIEVEKSKRRIIVSVKQLSVNPWENAQVSEGDVIEVEIVKASPEGFKIEYAGLNGYMGKATVRSRDPESIKEGEIIKVKVRIFDGSKQRFIVSMRDAEERIEKDNFSKFMKNQDKMTNTFGEYLSDLDNNYNNNNYKKKKRK